MRARLENWLTDIWYRRQRPPWYLRSLVPLYRRLARAPGQRRERPKRPIILVVGNIVVGGSGKTPMVIYLCRLCARMNLRVAVISRGYGRASRGLRKVSATDSARQVGDEALLIHQQTGVDFWVCEDRAVALAAAADADVVISDDGLQSRDLPRDLEVCMFDGERLIGNGHLLPAGPLREPPRRLARVNYLLVTGAPQRLAALRERLPPLPDSVVSGNMSLEVHALRPLRGGAAADLEDWHGREVHAVSGIANPGRFHASLESLGMRPRALAFPDHHEFSPTDFDGLEDLPVVMTAKDAIKCRGLELVDAWVLEVEAVPAATVESRLRDDIRRLLERSVS